MIELLIATMLFLSVCCAAVFITGAALFCVGAHLCWKQIQHQLKTEPKEDLQKVGAFSTGLQEVTHPDGGLDKEFDEWLANIPIA